MQFVYLFEELKHTRANGPRSLATPNDSFRREGTILREIVFQIDEYEWIDNESYEKIEMLLYNSVHKMYFVIC